MEIASGKCLLLPGDNIIPNNLTMPLCDMRLDGVAGEGLYPSPGLFYFRVADPALMSAIFRAYNHPLHF